jgi:ESS family glutamate:Na+ symporter
VGLWEVLQLTWAGSASQQTFWKVSLFIFFNISFISAGLTKNSEVKNSWKQRWRFFQGTLWMALIQGITFPLQAIVGGLAVLGFAFFGVELFSTFGFLSPLGFNEGPGQALSLGKTWEGIGFADAATIGLAFAAIGYLFAFFIGVPLANWGLRRGLAIGCSDKLPKEFIKGYKSDTNNGDRAGTLRLHSSNIDSLTFQASLIGVVYLITYFLVDFISGLFGQDTAKIIWGFFFFFGLIISVIVRFVMDLLQIGYLADEGIQQRITGWSVDFLIVAMVPAIQIGVIWQYALPIAVISLTNGLLTTLVVLYMGRRLVSDNLERMLAIYGTVTGTVSCGLLLLRIADPKFKTSVAIELAIMNIFVLVIIMPCTLMVNAPLWWGWRLEVTLLAYLGIAVMSYLFIRLLGLQGKAKF